jgi:hypothetical protein
MIRLNQNDSSILTQVAQYATDENADQDILEGLLEEASPDARDIGLMLLNKEPENPVTDDVKETVDYLRNWAQKNRAYAIARVAAG